jgi:hypothetical protein
VRFDIFFHLIRWLCFYLIAFDCSLIKSTVLLSTFFFARHMDRPPRHAIHSSNGMNRNTKKMTFLIHDIILVSSGRTDVIHSPDGCRPDKNFPRRNVGFDVTFCWATILQELIIIPTHPKCLLISPDYDGFCLAKSIGGPKSMLIEH